MADGSLRQLREVLENRCVAALRRNPALHLRKGLAGRNCIMHLLLCVSFVPAIAELDHIGCQRHAHAAQIVASAALQNFRRLLHL